MQHPARATNNFDAVRLVLAFIVVACHLGILTERPEYRPITAWLSSNFAVKGFFVLSGYLVSLSYGRSRSLADYAEKRARRIYPAYAVTILVSAVLGLLASTLPVGEYLASRATWKYLAANLTFLNFLQPTLPGAFANHPVTVLNGSLWTIKVELCLYACVPALAWALRKWGPYVTVALCLAAMQLWLLVLQLKLPISTQLMGELGRQFPAQLYFFGLGAAFAHARGWQPHLGKVLLGAAVLTGLGWNLPWARAVVEPVFFAALVLWAALRLPVQLPAGRWGDFSYGAYLLHFPLIQFLVFLGLFRGNAWLGAVVATGVVLAAAALMWHLVEKRWLKRTVNVEKTP
ncbi:acyltransferase [Hymenobacter sp. ASUV-10]|uniref:Acyltransferase n=1 Tax=Hymenobacter aranciens TaxID=3063996 RepID=A0ABT9BCM9_9BACT|nr:acyltransferase [Hymenobacter sp. ASUV-10]MDO7875408.1 acyltransferase [Hymenobacter sp. ASUV-10]